MKRFFAFLVCAVLLLTTLVPDVFGQRRRRSRFGRKARTAAIIAGGAGIGALIGGKKGAAIGAGSGALYSMNRSAARSNFDSKTRRLGTVLGGAALGSGLGAAFGGKRSAAVGALAGAGTSYVYSKRSRGYRRRYCSKSCPWSVVRRLRRLTSAHI